MRKYDLSECYIKFCFLFHRNFSTGFMHLKIAFKNGMYVIGQFSKPFSTVPEAIEFYTRNKLTLKGAEHKQLRHPVYKNECP